MNQDTVRETLQSVRESPVEYTALFSGKKNKRVNGFYKLLTKEIVVYDKNVVDDEGKWNKSLLTFTAIRELARHVMFSEKGNKIPRIHSQEFWARPSMTFRTLPKSGASIVPTSIPKHKSSLTRPAT
jgi:hypothetical protein